MPTIKRKEESVTQRLDAYVQKPGNTTMKLSADLGYKSDVARQWIKNGSIPGHMIDRVIQFLGKQ